MENVTNNGCRAFDASGAVVSPPGVAFEVSYEEGVEFHHERFATLAEAERRERELLEMGLRVISVFEVDADDG